MNDILIIRYPGCIFDEVQPLVDLAKNSNLKVEIADLEKISETSPARALVIPGGDCESAVYDDKLRQVLKKSLDKGSIIAGICNGALVLASAGVLIGKKCTHTAHPKHAPLPEFKELLEVAAILFKDAHYVDEDVVIDANVITANPRAAQQFAKAVLAKLG